MVNFIGLPNVERSVPPGLAPPMLRTAKRTARPMAALARLPWPSTPKRMFMPMRSRMGPFTHQHWRCAHGGGVDAVDVELLGADGLDGSDYNRQIFGSAASQNGVDGDLLDRRRRVIGRDLGHHILRVALGASEHAQHPLRGGWHHGQAVGEALVEQELVDVVGGRDFDLAGAQRAVFRFRPQTFGDDGILGERSATGPPLRQRLPI